MAHGNVHFTYDSECDSNNLCQGDLLRKTPELKSVLAEYHSYYDLDKYTHFIVLTQSCDLVRRDKKTSCKSRYISVAAVRSLQDVIARETSTSYNPIELDGIMCCSESKKSAAESFLNRLLNNNHPDYFFLKSCPEVGLVKDSCAFLHLSIALKSVEHYDKCLDARSIGLTENFRAKLGWLVGQLYSRIGTADYVPSGLPSKSEFKDYIEQILTDYIAWVPTEMFSEFRNAAKSSASADKATVLAAAERKVTTNREASLNRLVRKMINDISKLDENDETVLVEFFKSPQGVKLLSKLK